MSGPIIPPRGQPGADEEVPLPPKPNPQLLGVALGMFLRGRGRWSELRPSLNDEARIYDARQQAREENFARRAAARARERAERERPYSGARVNRSSHQQVSSATQGVTIMSATPPSSPSSPTQSPALTTQSPQNVKRKRHLLRNTLAGSTLALLTATAIYKFQDATSPHQLPETSQGHAIKALKDGVLLKDGSNTEAAGPYKKGDEFCAVTVLEGASSVVAVQADKVKGWTPNEPGRFAQAPTDDVCKTMSAASKTHASAIFPDHSRSHSPKKFANVFTKFYHRGPGGVG